MERELPLLDTRLCIRCGDCIAICPTECLALANQTDKLKVNLYPYLKQPRKCISCKACVWICPTQAIQMKGVD